MWMCMAIDFIMIDLDFTVTIKFCNAGTKHDDVVVIFYFILHWLAKRFFSWNNFLSQK